MNNQDSYKERSGSNINKEGDKVDLGYTISRPSSSLKPQENKPKNK